MRRKPHLRIRTDGRQRPTFFGRLVHGAANSASDTHFTPSARVPKHNGYICTLVACIWMPFVVSVEVKMSMQCFEASKGEAMTLDIDYIWPSRKAMTGSSLPRSRDCPRYAPGVHNDWKKIR